MQVNKQTIFYANIIGFILLLLVGCMRATGQDESIKTDILLQNQSNQRIGVYECSNGFTFTARIDDESAWLFLPNKTVRLAHVPSGSGAKYSKDQFTFWSKGEEAQLEIDDNLYRNCKNNRAKAIWENAKLNGIDFRAVGNEPAWYLEIEKGNKIVLIINYGQDRYEFATPEAVIDIPARKTIYEAQNDTNHLTVIIRGRRCRDSMSGESFETQVTVTLDRREFQGCGRALH